MIILSLSSNMYIVREPQIIEINVAIPRWNNSTWYVVDLLNDKQNIEVVLILDMEWQIS